MTTVRPEPLARQLSAPGVWLLVINGIFGLQSVSLAVLPGLAGTQRPLVEVSGALFGPLGALVMMAGMVAFVGGNLAGALFSTPRITYALALDGRLPASPG